jgi:hypothetical protein
LVEDDSINQTSCRKHGALGIKPSALFMSLPFRQVFNPPPELRE